MTISILKYPTLIIGAGQIAAGYDTPASLAVLTHAHAVSQHPDLKLVGFIDPTLSAAQKAATTWGGKCWATLDDFLASDSPTPQVIIVAVPDPLHVSVTLDALRLLPTNTPSVLVLEKPLATSTIEAQPLLWLGDSHPHCHVIVNYQRHLLPRFHALRDAIARDTYGKLLTGTGLYGKGILHNGTHLLDWLRLLLGGQQGEISKVQATHVMGDTLTTLSPTATDRTVSGWVEFTNGGTVMLNGVDSRAITHFELDLFFERAHIQLLDSGFTLRITPAAESERFSGHTVVDSHRALPDEPTGLDRALVHLADAIVAALETTSTPSPCSIDDAYQALYWAEHLLQQSNTLPGAKAFRLKATL